MNRYPSYLRPAGQVSVSISPLPQGFSASGFDANMQPIVAAGLNAANQLVDATGALVLDASGRPIVPVQTPAPAPAPIVPAPAPAPAPAPMRRGYSIFGMLVTAGIIGGAAYVGSYYGAKRAVRG